eukprot:CAMPEP_0172491828 /NCGR_PEP_ID=MMETSP1066-20121228/22722_1 /TAXON_ID=671091 /ORGANISM="Coscinodiscus wailesii, Strain CCMP2513" /LENGTH=170 /DNA_ID=CAMNT_0013261077 /DNA_START=60 /DNA_END=572 /DNA_ORIENTATION=+
MKELLLTILISYHFAQCFSSPLQKCNDWGFNPSTLSCETCQLLPSTPSTLITECQTCCQKFILNNPKETIYKSAILVATSNRGDGDLNDFLEKDWDALVDRKGDNLLRTPPYVYSPPVVYFFNEWVDGEKVVKSYQDFERVVNMADEEVGIGGWKRDDIRELLEAYIMDE